MSISKPINIAKKNIGLDFEPFIIAEMSGNHNQDLERAIRIVEAAADAGAHAIKLQTYTADSLTLDIKEGDFLIKDKKSIWTGKNLYDLYKSAYTPWEWHKEIFKIAKEKNIICFSTPFSEKAVDFLESLNTPAYKIASFENNHLPLIKEAASTGKPLIISTGMSNLTELEQAVETARDAGCKDLILLKCTSSYPADPKESNLKTIDHMRKLFNCEVGLSDHTEGIGAAIASVACGSTVIEKHLTLSRKDKGVDSDFSIEPDELKTLVIESKRAWQSLGKISYERNYSEKQNLVFRRSIYVAENIKKGEVFNKSNLRIIRPGYGLNPYLLEKLIGKKSKYNLKRGTPLKFEQII